MGKLMPLSPSESEVIRGEFQFPSNWVVELAQYAFNEVRDGTHDSPKDAAVGVPLVTSKNLINGSIDFTNTKIISYDDHIEISKRSGVSTGDLLFSMIGTIGNVAVVPEHTNFSVKNVGLFRKNDDLLNRRFAFYWLKSQPYQKYLEERQRGGNQKFVSLGILRESPIPIPPLAEQKVIAEKLDTLLAQVDNTKARLERIPEILKRFRQSVLAAAVSGKLTEEWRGNSNSAKSSQQEAWLWPDVPDSWMVKFYPDVVESRLGKMLDKAKNTGEPTKYLGNINVRWFHFDLENTQEILISKSERDELLLRNGDILICEGGEPGRCAIWKETSADPIIFQKALHRARVKDDIIIPEWLVFNIKNDTDNLTLEQLFTGTTIKHLTGKALKKYPLRIPPLKEQTEIVRRVEELFAFADRIEHAAQAAFSRVNNLTQSILAKAFRGELTADWRAANPELISGENSAEALLARIKAERAKVSIKKGRKMATVD